MGKIYLYGRWKNLVRIDELCKLYEAWFFEIKGRVCLVCRGKELKEVKGFVILNEKERKKFENYYLKCTKCETPSILLKPHW